MANFNLTAAPTWARKVWADSENIYLEIPAVGDAPPFIQKYSKSDQGLSKALALICLAFDAQAPKGGTYPIAKHPLVNRAKPGILNYSEGSRERAREVLQKLKLIGSK